MKDLVVSDRRQQDGGYVLAAEERDTGIEPADIDEQARDDAETVEGRTIFTQGDLIRDSSLEIFGSHPVKLLIRGGFEVRERIEATELNGTGQGYFAGLPAFSMMLLAR
jgi:hypothetical protein